MSREIKFRGWNKIEGRMFNPKVITPFAVDSEISEKIPDGLFLPFHEDVELMQYTGQKESDKPNAKELYHKDVISAWMPAPWDDQVPVHIHFVIEWEFGGWWASGIGTNEYDDFLAHIGDCRLDGNVFQNPELLEVRHNKATSADSSSG